MAQEQELLNRSAEFLAIKERELGRRISHEEIANETGLNRDTIGRYIRNRVTRYDAPIVLALCSYFGCDIRDFFIIKSSRESPNTPENETPLAAGF